MAELNETYHDEYDQYLNGELFGQDLDRFNHRLKNDEEFRLGFERYKFIVDGIKSYRKAQLVSLLEERGKAGAGNIPKIAWMIPAAAVLVIGMVWFIWNPGSQSGENIVEQEETPTQHDAEKEVVIDTTGSENDSNLFVLEDPPEPTAEIVEDEPLESTNDIAVASRDELQEFDLEEESDDSLQVKKDRLIVSAESIQFVYFDRSLEKKSNEQVESMSTPSRSSGWLERRRAKKAQEDSEEAEEKTPAYESDKSSSKLEARSQNLNVEYWESVVNFVGYQFDGRTIKLYGQSRGPLLIHRYQNKIYLQKGDKYYLILADSEPHTLPVSIPKPEFIQ
jgi:hypothetical protein